METETGPLLSSLNNQRTHALGILEGLSEDALRRPVLPSADAAAWQVAPAVSAGAVFDAYRQEIERANAVITTTALDTAPALWPDELWPTWKLQDLRAILLHVITETACHAGHLDAARD